MSEQFLTVSELNNYIKDVIHAGFPQPLWLCGEIQGFNRNKTKSHIFFELVEKDPDSKDILAKIGLVIFAGRKAHIQSILKESQNAFELKDDIEVKFACKIDFYAPHGALRLVVESIDPVYTLGKLAQEKQKLIATLQKEGTLDQNKKHTLPLVPLNVGLVTSDDSAAYNDFLSEFQKSHLGFKLYLRDTLMQGSKAEKDIVKAIGELERIKSLDLIVITRGGGSLADLSCFDSAKIAHKIASCRLPVLSGIGHEINLSITDMAAHTYAKTPTAIAQFLVNAVECFIADLDEKLTHICQEAERMIDSQKQKLKNSASLLQNGTMQFLNDHNEMLIRFFEYLKHAPATLLNDAQRTIRTNKENLTRVVKNRFQNDKLKLKNFEKLVDIVHPKNTMKRGFSITRTKDGKLVRAHEDVKVEEILVTQVANGAFESQRI